MHTEMGCLPTLGSGCSYCICRILSCEAREQVKFEAHLPNLLGHTLTYDYDDQLTSTGGSGFAYDAAGRRASRTAGGVTTSFLYDGGAVLLEKQGGTTTATYTYGTSLIRKDGETPLFDGLGSERTVTNSSQAVTASLTLQECSKKWKNLWDGLSQMSCTS